MIEVDLSEFLALILLAVAVLAGVTAAWDRVHERRMARKVRRRTVRCRICSAVFLRTERGPRQSCPACRSETRAGRDRRLG